MSSTGAIKLPFGGKPVPPAPEEPPGLHEAETVLVPVPQSAGQPIASPAEVVALLAGTQQITRNEPMEDALNSGTPVMPVGGSFADDPTARVPLPAHPKSKWARTRNEPKKK